MAAMIIRGEDGEFTDLTEAGKEILGITSKGLYISKNEGRTWSKRSENKIIKAAHYN